MGTHKKTRKFQVKKIIGQRDARLKKNQETGKNTAADAQKKKSSDEVIREA
jgi:U3 small nucleolar RNA-associated protein 24